MTTLIASLALQMLCQLIGSGVPDRMDGNISANHRPVALPDGYVAHPDIGLAYKIHNENVTWTEARERCNLMGAQLAIIDSSKKLERLTNQEESGTSHAHIGIYRMDDKWVGVGTGVTLSNVPWLMGFPSSTRFHCARIQRTIPQGIYNNDCNSKFNYICEVRIPEGYNAQENLVAEKSVK